MQAWDDDKSNYPKKPQNALNYVIGALRCISLAVLVFGGLATLLVLRLFERPIWGQVRPFSPYLTCFVCRNALRILQLDYEVVGQPSKQPGAIVANHASWIDIFALNARQPVYFVAKAEVRNWPGIGWLARATGTLFIHRDPKQAKQQTQLFTDRLLAGHKLLFFPEGTSTDGRRILPFKPTLFQSFLTPDLRENIIIQPVAVTYHAPDGQDDRFYGWWGEMSFGGHLWATLCARKQGRVRVHYLDPIVVRDVPERKALAQTCEQAIRLQFGKSLGSVIDP